MPYNKVIYPYFKLKKYLRLVPLNKCKKSEINARNDNLSKNEIFDNSCRRKMERKRLNPLKKENWFLIMICLPVRRKCCSE